MFQSKLSVEFVDDTPNYSETEHDNKRGRQLVLRPTSSNNINSNQRSPNGQQTPSINNDRLQHQRLVTKSSYFDNTPKQKITGNVFAAVKQNSKFRTSDGQNADKENKTSSINTNLPPIAKNNTYQGSKINSNQDNNGLSLMPLPKPKLPSDNTTISKEQSTKINKLPSTMKFGESEIEKSFIFTGTVERVIKWGKIFQNQFCHFEVFGSVISITEGNIRFQKIMLLRDNRGPILQVIYYSIATHIHIEDFYLGQILRIVGRMIGPNIMSANTIRVATLQEIEALPRMCCICDNAVSKFCNINPTIR